MESDRIERQYQDEQDLYKYLMDCNEVSFASYIDDVYKKVLLLSAASYFETVVSEAIVDFAKNAAAVDTRVAVLVQKKAISRQYHTLFDWKANNTNAFWNLFGEETKKKVRSIIDADEELKCAERDFVDLGRTRNFLVHENYSEYDINLTVDEIYTKYKSACKFVAFIPRVFDSSFL